MKPHIICHMLPSVDGRIDGAALSEVVGKGEYEATGGSLGGDAWVCGRTTMERHFAEEGASRSSRRHARRSSAWLGRRVPSSHGGECLCPTRPGPRPAPRSS